MGKDIGTCLRLSENKHINRSKYKNAKDAKEQLDILIGLEVINLSNVVYKCPICNSFHVGLKEWENRFKNEM